jgi:methylmalonyl-CoA mutase N-terminal domain/subunit
MVGVNTLTGGVGDDLTILRISDSVEKEQNAVLARRRDGRDNAEVQRRLAEMTAVASGSGNLIPPMLAAARAEATLGEICNALRDIWGTYTEPARI